MTQLSVAESSDQREASAWARTVSHLQLCHLTRPGSSCGRRGSGTSSSWLHSALRPRVQQEERSNVPKTVVERLKTNVTTDGEVCGRQKKGLWVFSEETFWPEEAESEK